MTIRTFKPHENRGLILSLAAASLLLGLVGCGGAGSSDPTAQYKDLNANVAPHKEQARSQMVLERSYVIEPEKDVTFIEGESSSFKVRVRTFFAVDSYNLKLTGVSEGITGLSLKPDPSEAGSFIMSYTAPQGVIPTDRQERQVKYGLELTDVKSSDASVEQLFRSINKSQVFSFAIRRTGKTPVIVALNSVPGEVEQGGMATFSVDVMDPASYEGYAPRLDVYFQGTNKTSGGYEANGATYVRVDSIPKRQQNGTWRFSYVFDAKNNDVGAQLSADGKRVDGATHLNTRMLLKAYSASGGVSAEKVVLVKIKYSQPQLANPVEQCPKPVVEKPVAKTAKATTAATTAATSPVTATPKTAKSKTAKNTKKVEAPTVSDAAKTGASGDVAKN